MDNTTTEPRKNATPMGDIHREAAGNGKSATAGKKIARVKVEPREISPRRAVTTIRQGARHMEIMELAKKPRCGIRKLNRDEYRVIATGEVRRYKKTENKQAKSLAQTYRELRWLIRTNFEADTANQQFLTLTYAENMRDPERLYRDFEIFAKRLKRHMKGHKLSYIAVAEPQGRGAWHMHVLLKTDRPRLYLDWREAERMWGQGQLDGQALGLTRDKNGKATGAVDDLGLYFAAYFTSLTDESKKGTDGKRRAREKGARIHYYPKGFRFYRCSRGIKRPERGEAEYRHARAGWGAPAHAEAVELTDVTDPANPEMVQGIQREHYKKPLPGRGGGKTKKAPPGGGGA